MLRKILTFYFKIYGIFQLELDNIDFKEKILDEKFEFRILNSDEIWLLKKINSKRKFFDWYEKIIESTDYKCFVIIDKVKNCLAYYSWVNFSNNYYLHEVNTTLNFKEIDACLFQDDNTMEEYRRLGLHTYIMNERIKYCKQLGIKRVYITIFLKNKPAIKTVKKFNFKRTNIFPIYYRKGTISYSIKKVINFFTKAD